jgi:polyketide biosynthesis acyl carrier protein
MSKEDIFNIVIKHTRSILPDLDNYTFKINDKLVELGANSIDRADIVTMTLESLSLKMPRVELAGVKNIGELVDALYEKLHA